jgi:hypothetical protein
MGGYWFPHNYFAYIRSPQWAAVVHRYFKMHPRRCAACPADVGIQLHHKTYVRLEAERDSDLVPLCNLCHSMVHGIHQMAGAELDRVTDEWIRTGKGGGNLPARRREVLVSTPRSSHKGHAPRTQVDAIVHVGSFSYVAKDRASFVVWSTFARKPKAVWRGVMRREALLVSESIDRRAQQRLEAAAGPTPKRPQELTREEQRKLLSPPIPDIPERRARPSHAPSVKQQLADRFGRHRIRGTETFGYLKNIPPTTNYGDDT